MAQEITIKVTAANAKETKAIQDSLQTLAQKIDPENLEILAKKSKKLGINKKIQQYQAFL